MRCFKQFNITTFPQKSKEKEKHIKTGGRKIRPAVTFFGQFWQNTVQ